MDRMNKELELVQADYERFRNLILERNGLHFSEDKRQSLKRGLAGALQKSSCASLGEYYELLRCSPSSSSQWEQLVSELTVGETYFFRNKGYFDALTKHILPEIIAQREHSNRRIRIWSAGCATGEEPYSVAMLLRQLIPNLHSWNILILATGSEVHLALAAYEELVKQGVAVRVVSMPSWEVFEAQDGSYRNEVLPATVSARLAIEAGVSMGWERYVGPGGKILGIERFGASAPGGVVLEKFGFTAEAVMAAVREMLGRS